MMRALLTFEWTYHQHQLTWRAAAVLFFLLGVAFGRAGLGGGDMALTAPFSVAVLAALISLASVLAVAPLTGHAILRDDDYAMTPLIFATAVPHYAYVLSRFTGLVFAAGSLMILASLGMMIGALTAGIGIANLPYATYFWSLWVLMIPNALLGCAVLFATAALTRSSAATFISAVLLYIVYWTGAILGRSPLIAGSSPLPADLAALAAVLEPYATIAILEETRHWSAAAKATTLPPLMGHLLLNRLLWLAFSLGLFAMTYRGFRIRRVLPKRRKKQGTAEANTAPVSTLSTAAPPVVAVTPSGTMATALALLRQTRLLTLMSVRSVPFFALLLLWIFFLFITLRDRLQSGELGVSLTATTAGLLPAVSEPLVKLGVLVMLWFAADIAGRERSTRFDGLMFSTPLGGTVMPPARVLATTLISLFLVTVTALICALFQLAVSDMPVHVNLLLRLYLYAGLPLAWAGALALIIHGWITNKYAALLVSCALLIPFTGLVLNQSPLIAHPLLRFGAMPELRLSAMTSGGYYDGAALWYALYWTSLVTGLSLVAWRFQPMPKLSWRRSTWLSSAGSLALAAIASWQILAGMQVAHQAPTKQLNAVWRADYERQLLATAAWRQPQISAIDVTVTLNPRQRSYTLAGTLELTNPHDTPLSKFLVGLPPFVRQAEIGIANGDMTWQNARLRSRKLQWQKPLLPGEQRQLTFVLEAVHSPFGNLNPEAYCLPNASYVELDKVMPQLGFRESFVLKDSDRREALGLPRQPPMPTMTQLPGWVHARVKVNAPTTWQVVSSAPLRAQQDSDSHRQYHFETAQSTGYGFAIAGAPYETSHFGAGNAAITVYYHAGHGRHAARMAAAAKDAQILYGARFGAIPVRPLAIVEIPDYSSRFGATAYADAIFGGEQRLFLLALAEHDLDAVSRMIMHEVAHQWWGGRVEPLPVKGAPLLTEGLAEYSEMVAFEDRYGRQASLDYMAVTTDLYFYFRGFAAETEPPLATVEDQSHVTYFKGPHVMWALREILGEGTMDHVLRDFFSTYAGEEHPRPQDLVDRLLSAAPGDQRATVASLLHAVVTYDIGLRGARRERTALGSALHLDITALRIDTTGGERNETVLQQPLEVAITRDGAIIARHQIRLTKPQQSVTLPVPMDSDGVILDPRHLLLEANRADNMKSLQTAPH